MSESTRGIFLHIPYMVALKDAPAAILCSQIHYWYSPQQKNRQSKLRVRKQGKLWIAKSNREWSDETGLTFAQVKRGLEVLARGGVIEKAVFRFNGAPTVHVRALKIQGAVLREHEYIIPIEVGSQSQEPSPLVIGDESVALHSPPLATGAKSLTVTTQEISTETTQHSLASSDAGLPKSQMPKHPPEKKNKNDEAVGMLAVKEDIPVDISSEPITATLPREVWYQLTQKYSEKYGEYLPLKAKELAQLNRLFKDLGPRSEPVLRLLFLRWDRFSKQAKISHGAYSIPALPTIDFIVRYSQAALHFWKLDCQENVAILQSNTFNEECGQISEPKYFVADVAQTAGSQSIEPQPMAVSGQCSKVVNIEDGHIATLEEIQAYRQLRLANKKAKEELLASNSHPKLISSSLVSPTDELLKYGSLAPCPLVPELESTITSTVADATKGDSFGDWVDEGDSEF